MELNKEYWSDRYKNQDIGWDYGSITFPLKAYFDQLTDKSITILIPGAGNGHEAEYLYRKGFSNIVICDISEYPLQQFQARVPNFPNRQLIRENFFNLKGNYDLIVEQTFFCALNPSLRKSYAIKCAELLKTGGKLVGLLFNCEFADSPPFGGSKEEYLPYFENLFEIKYFDECYNSIPKRTGRELFIKLVKK